MRQFSIVLSIFLLASCGPTYRENYKFIPPKNQVGLQCIQNCLTEKNFCNEICDRQELTCKGQEIYVPGAKHYEPSLFDTMHCQTGGCKNNCDTDYRSCYQQCGGIVESYQECTAFCPKAQ